MFAFRFLLGRRMTRHLRPPGKVGSHRQTWQRHETLCKRATRRQPLQPTCAVRTSGEFASSWPAPRSVGRCSRCFLLVYTGMRK
jgi:hypothetical protein